MPLTYTEGDSTATAAPGCYLLAHIGNDVNAWGKGYVVSLTRRFGPYPAERYHAWYKGQPALDGFPETRTGVFALGEVQFVAVGMPDGPPRAEGLHAVFAPARNAGTTGTTRWANGSATRGASTVVVATMIAQHDIKRGKFGSAPIRYDALRESCVKVSAWLNARQDGPWTVQIPRIGTGLAGGEWDHIEPILKREWAEHTVRVYDPLPPGFGPRGTR